jgi:hypothetical protein
VAAVTIPLAKSVHRVLISSLRLSSMLDIRVHFSLATPPPPAGRGCSSFPELKYSEEE